MNISSQLTFGYANRLISKAMIDLADRDAIDATTVRKYSG